MNPKNTRENHTYKQRKKVNILRCPVKPVTYDSFIKCKWLNKISCKQWSKIPLTLGVINKDGNK
jgi:hypothetical protein